MSLPWLKDDYKKPSSTRSSSRSRSRSGSRSRRGKSDRKSKSRSRSRSRSSGRERSRGGGYNRERGSFRRDSGRGRGNRNRRHRSNSSSSGSRTSNSRSPTRLVASDRPKYVNARVFVANILSKDVTKEQLISHFEKYGNVVDVLIHAKNYAFIQYLKTDHAILAVEGENGSVFNGMRIDVKMANENRKAGGGSGGRGERGGRGGGPAGRGGRGGPAGGGDGPDRERLPPNDPYGPSPYLHGAGRPPFPPPLPGEFGRDPYFPDPYRRPYPPDPWLDDPYRRDPYADPYRDPYAPRAPPPQVECVIFFVNRQLQTYAEDIERKIKDQSIIATSAIIPEGRSAPQMIDDLSSRGGLFAIFVNAQNETHRSLTLNILHGTPQEHRNMPLDDAIILIGRSFEKYVEDLRAKANANNSKAEPAAAPAAPAPASGASHTFMSPSSEIKYLLNLLADNQALTVQELNTVIQYLKDRRDKLLETEKGPLAIQGSPDPRRPEEDRRFPDRRSSERIREPGYGKISPSRSMDRGYPDRSERRPADRDYNDQMSYDRDRPPAGDRYEKEQTPDASKPIHEELTKKILSIFQGGNPDVISQFSSAPPVSAPPAPTPAPPPPPSSASSSANLINFDNPNVQKALDNLIQSGPNLLKSIAPKMSSASTSLATSSGSDATPGKSGSGKNGYGQPPVQGQGQMGPQMMDSHMAQGMYMMEDMQGQMANMGMPVHGGSQGPMHQMSMANPMQHMAPHYMMQGMGMPAQSDGYGPQAGFHGAPGPPLPRGAPPPPPPPHQQY